jgi:hypothetical protein
MLVGVSVQVRPVVDEIEEARVTVPVNPFVGATVITEAPAAPTSTASEAGEALMLKSGTTATTVTVIV